MPGGIVSTISRDPCLPKIKILYFIDNLLGYGGTENHLLELLSCLDKSKFEPVVCCFTAGVFGEEIRKLGIRVYVLPVNRLYGINAFKSAIKLVGISEKKKYRSFRLFI